MSPFSHTDKLEVVRPTPCSAVTGTTSSEKHNLKTAPTKPALNKLFSGQLNKTKITVVWFPAPSITYSTISSRPGANTSKSTALSFNFTIKTCSTSWKTISRRPKRRKCSFTKMKKMEFTSKGWMKFLSMMLISVWNWWKRVKRTEPSDRRIWMWKVQDRIQYSSCWLRRSFLQKNRIE